MKRTILSALTVLVASTVVLAPSVVSPETSAFGINSTVSAQTQTTTLRVPAGVPDGSTFKLFGQGWGQSYPVQNGQITLPWNRGAAATFGNFQLADGSWFRLEDLSSVPSGWGSVVRNGQHALGNHLATDSVENFLESSTYALVGPVYDDAATSSFTVSYAGGQARLDLPSSLNSVSFSAAAGTRPALGLPTNEGQSVGLINVGDLMRDSRPAVVVEGPQGPQIVPATNVGGNSWTAPVPSGSHFQWVYVQNGTNILAWSTVGAARTGSGVTVQDGTGTSNVGPYSYRAN